MRFLPFVISIGILLSGYAWYVELKVAEAHRLGVEYKAYCDIGMFSCTKVFSSEYGSVSQFVGLPKVSNAIIGALFYMVELLLEPYTPLLMVTASAGMLASIALFTLLTVVMKDFCVVCFSIYIVNIITFVTAYRRWKKAGSNKAIKRQ